MSTSPNETETGMGQLGLWDAISIIVGIVIGTTIFKLPWLVFANTSDPFWGMAVWAIGGLIALIGAFCYAELAATYPKSGGDYYYLSKGFKPSTGFLFGWAQLAIVMPASIGGMAYVFADFLQQFLGPNAISHFEVPVSDERTLIVDPYFGIAAQVVLVIALLNILGVVMGKTVQNLLTAAKVIGLVGIIVAGFGWGAPHAWEYVEKVPKAPETSIPIIGSLAMILVLYAYGGWNDSAFVAAEVRNPKRNIPRALFVGIAIIVSVYLLVNAAYINGLGWSNVTDWNPKSVPLRVVEHSLEGTDHADWGGKAMSIIIMVSALGAVNGLTFTGARVYATLGADHRLFGWMGYWRPGKGAPIVSLIIQAALTVFIVWAITTQEGHNYVNQGLGYVNDGLQAASKLVQQIDDKREIPTIDFEQEWKSGDGFEKLVDRTAPVFWFFFMLTGLSLFRLRERYKEIQRPYSVPFYPMVPLLFCCACAWMLYQATTYVGWHALFAIIILMLGFPLYWVSRTISGPLDEEGPITFGLPRPTAPTPQPPAQKPWR
ncbi:MAG TPA: amino acid permease [Gemmataceae bacterium]|nr:amino acid permease [Gemmataceae bacterium]